MKIKHIHEEREKKIIKKTWTIREDPSSIVEKTTIKNDTKKSEGKQKDIPFLTDAKAELRDKMGGA